MNGGDILRELTDFVFVRHDPSPADVICIPGGSYPAPSERAAELYLRGFAPYVLPSGRFSVKLGRFAGVRENAPKYDGDYSTEWEFMADVLVKNGVPQSAVLREDRAEFTMQNARFSRLVTDRAGITVRKGILCCKAYHARRALTYYADAFPEAEWIVCPAVTGDIRRENWFLDPDKTATVLGEISRIGSQFRFEEISRFSQFFR